MPIDVRRQITAHLSLLHTALGYVEGETNPAFVKEFLESTKIKEIDQFVSEVRKSGEVKEKEFNEGVNEAWAVYSEQEGGAVPDEIQSNAATIKKRIIYLEALQKNLVK